MSDIFGGFLNNLVHSITQELGHGMQKGAGNASAASRKAQGLPTTARVAPHTIYNAGDDPSNPQHMANQIGEFAERHGAPHQMPHKVVIIQAGTDDPIRKPLQQHPILGDIRHKDDLGFNPTSDQPMGSMRTDPSKSSPWDDGDGIDLGSWFRKHLGGLFE